jgi:hypothetical protein
MAGSQSPCKYRFPLKMGGRASSRDVSQRLEKKKALSHPLEAGPDNPKWLNTPKG